MDGGEIGGEVFVRERVCVFVCICVCAAVLGRVHCVGWFRAYRGRKERGKGREGQNLGAARAPSFLLLLLAYLYRCG